MGWNWVNCGYFILDCPMIANHFLAISIFCFAFAGKLIYDVSLYKKEKKNNHFIGGAAVLVVIAVCSLLGGWLSIPMWLFCWWALFDPAYAKSIHQKWNYIGTTAWLDKLQSTYPVITYIKFGGAIISIILYIIYGS
jgi:hypothetical protein